jgi:hypothetical protein
MQSGGEADIFVRLFIVSRLDDCSLALNYTNVISVAAPRTTHPKHYANAYHPPIQITQTTHPFAKHGALKTVVYLVSDMQRSEQAHHDLGKFYVNPR